MKYYQKLLVFYNYFNIFGKNLRFLFNFCRVIEGLQSLENWIKMPKAGRPEGSITDPMVLEITKIKELLRSKEKILKETRKAARLEGKNKAKLEAEQKKNKEREQEKAEIERRRDLGLSCDDLLPDVVKKRLEKQAALNAQLEELDRLRKAHAAAAAYEDEHTLLAKLHKIQAKRASASSSSAQSIQVDGKAIVNSSDCNPASAMDSGKVKRQ